MAEGLRPLLWVVLGHAGEVVRDVASLSAKEEGHDDVDVLTSMPFPVSFMKNSCVLDEGPATGGS